MVYAREEVKTGSDRLETSVAYGTTAGNNTDKSIIETENGGWDQATTEKVFEGTNYKVTFTLASYWDTGYNAAIKLENTGESTIQNWCLGFEYECGGNRKS